MVIYASSCVQIDTRYLNIDLFSMRKATLEIIMAKDNKKSKKTAAADNGSTEPSSDDTNTARQIVVIQMHRASSSKAQASLMLKSQ